MPGSRGSFRAAAERLYRRLLALYPSEFRSEYGDEMSRLFSDRSRDEPLPRLAIQVLADLAKTAPREHFNMWLKDLRLAARVMARNRGFSLVAVASLALGIGAATAIFSVFDAVLVRPLPYPAADRIVWLSTTDSANKEMGLPLSVPDFDDWRLRNRSLAQIAITRAGFFNLSDGGEAERLPGARVSAAFLKVLDLHPVLGRDFAQGDDAPGAEPVALLTHSLFEQRYGADPGVIGRSILLDGQPHTVVGVLPAALRYPSAEMQVVVPLVPQMHERVRTFRFARAVGRLRDGASVESASADFAALANAFAQEYPDSDRGVGITVVPLQEQLVGPTRPALVVLMGAVGLVLLIASANVTSLLLARSTSRRGEMATRVALGAGQGALLRQSLAESLLLGLAGGALGAAIATVGVPAMVRLPGSTLPATREIGVDLRALSAALVIAVGTGLVVGLFPGWRASRQAASEHLKESGRSGTGRHKGALGMLIVLEMALALVLLVGAGLLTRSLGALGRVDPGFSPENVLSMSVSIAGPRAKDQDAQIALHEHLLEAVRAIPGVEAVGGATRLPVVGFATVNFGVYGQPRAQGTDPVADYRVVSSGYLESLKIRLVAGRSLGENDTAHSPDAVMVNETLARRFYRYGTAIGGRVRLVQETTRFREIVGVVADVRNGRLDGDIRPAIYVPYRQNTWPGALRNVWLFVRSPIDVSALTSSVRAELKRIDPQQTMSQVRLLKDVVAESLAPQRLNASLLVAFGAVAAILAAVGIYGVTAYAVAQRARELGIRSALGAQRRDLVRLVVGEGVRLAAVGVFLGVVAALALSRWARALLFGVSAADPLTYAWLAVFLVALALFATWLPARRASRSDPLTVLRVR